MSKRYLPAAVMITLIVLTFCPIPVLLGQASLLGLDFQQLHLFRIRFAREMIPLHGLPAWYPRELLGGPFWGNVHNFPFVPSRLVLLLFPPERMFAPAVILSAALAAFFTYGFCRSIGFPRLASAGAGLTFACCGTYSAEVAAGALPILEGHPALPLLLWASERALTKPRASAVLALSGFLVALCGHPQRPFYGLVVASAYLLFRCRKEPRRAVQPLLCLALGAGLSAFAWVPTLELGWRSTRALALDASNTSVAFPYFRLASFFLPWGSGRLPPLAIPPGELMFAAPSPAFFWDTVCYAGLLPWAGLALWLRRRGDEKLRFLFLAGALALALALPFFQDVLQSLPGTLLRSPARQIYVTDFALAIAFAVLISRAEKAKALAFALLALQVADLGAHARAFAIPTGFYPSDPIEVARAREFLGPYRAAIDQNLRLPENREVDDVGAYEPSMLARTYRGILALSGAPPGLNVESFDGKQLSRRALDLAGVRLVVTLQPRPDLGPDLGAPGAPHRYVLPSPAPRAEIVSRDRVSLAKDEEIAARLRDPGFDPRASLLVPEGTAAAGGGGQAAYDRPSPDEIVVRTKGEGGALRVTESFDPGWAAEIDGSPLALFPADGFLLGAWIPPGEHGIVFRYSTPGRVPGLLVTLFCAVALALLLRRQSLVLERSAK